jgi:F0F1-type ATP synthase assembly protein I
MRDPLQLNKYSELMGLGIEIAVAMAFPVVLGIYIDHRFASTPWGVLTGVLLGVVSMALKLYKVTVGLNTKKRKPPTSHTK